MRGRWIRTWKQALLRWEGKVIYIFLIHLFAPVWSKLTHNGNSHIILSKAGLNTGFLNFVWRGSPVDPCLNWVSAAICTSLTLKCLALKGIIVGCLWIIYHQLLRFSYVTCYFLACSMFENSTSDWKCRAIIYPFKERHTTLALPRLQINHREQH